MNPFFEGKVNNLSMTVQLLQNYSYTDNFAICLVLAKVDTFINDKKCVEQCERVQQSTAMSSN